METLSIQLSNLSEVSLRCGSDIPENGSRAVQPPFGAPILVADGQLGSNCRNQAITLIESGQGRLPLNECNGDVMQIIRSPIKVGL